MSYTGEAYNGKKFIHDIVEENEEVKLDDIICKIGAGNNNRKLYIKSVTNTGNFWGANYMQQNNVVTGPSAYGMGLYKDLWTEILPGYWFDMNGSTQKLIMRTDQNSKNRGLYQITIVAGVGNNASGFNKFSLLIERL